MNPAAALPRPRFPARPEVLAPVEQLMVEPEARFVLDFLRGYTRGTTELLEQLRAAMAPTESVPTERPSTLSDDETAAREFGEACDFASRLARRVVEDLEAFSPQGVLGRQVFTLARSSLAHDLEAALREASDAAGALGELAEDMFDAFDAGLALTLRKNQRMFSAEELRREFGLP